jgi:hypothetical protein
LISIRFLQRAACATAAALLAAACSTPAPAPRAPVVQPSAHFAAMIKSMQLPADQISYFDQASKPITQEAFNKAINGTPRAKYTVKATRHFNNGVWTDAAEVYLVDDSPVAKKAT